MIFTLYRSNQPLVMATFPVVALLAMLPDVLSMGDAPVLWQWPLFLGFMDGILPLGGWWALVAAWVMVVSGAVVVNEYFNRHDFLNEASHIPGFFYSLFGGLIAADSPLAPWGMFFFLLALGRITNLRKQLRVVHFAFEAGLFAAVASLFVPSLLVVLPMFSVTAVANRSANLRELLMPFVGAFVVAWLWFSLLFVFSPGEDFTRYTPQFTEPVFSLPGPQGWVMLVASLIGLPGFLGSFSGSTVKSRGEKTAFMSSAVALAGALLVQLFWQGGSGDAFFLPVVAVLSGFFFRKTKIRPEAREALFYLLIATALAVLFFTD